MKYRYKWLISFGHAFVLLLLTAVWINSNYTYGDEQMLIQRSSVFKRVVLGIDEDPPKNEYLFINLAHEKALIPLADGLGNEVITDREKLTAFFKIVKQHQKNIKFTICDVFLQGQSPHDSLLQTTVSGINNIVFPTHYDAQGQVERLDLKVPHALADYRMANSGFLKFKLFQNDTLPTLPVYLYQRIAKQHITKSKGWYYQNEHPILNSLIIDYQIRPFELFEQAEYPVVNLSELLILPEEVVFHDFLKNRIIVMGDFQNDVHETIFGSAPGTLILLNVFLTLQDAHHLISYWWITFLIIGYTVFSRLMLFPPQPKEGESYGWFSALLGSATFLMVFSVASYLLFNQHLQVMVLTIYINLLRFAIRLKQQEWTIANIKEHCIKIRETYLNFK
jgi:hypothetical protein